MPEICEYVKLAQQLQPAWTKQRVEKITAPANSPNPKKYYQGDWQEFSDHLRSHTILNVSRFGKNLWINLQPGPLTWRIHLSSTGWFLPGNELALSKCSVDPIHQNFLHFLSPKTVRLTFTFRDGQRWDYHDGRTWGSFYLYGTSQPREVPDLKLYGPDWGGQPTQAMAALVNLNSNRFAKDVLTDQHVTAGLGNYLACEILHRARINPFKSWHQIGLGDRQLIGVETLQFLRECLNRQDHSHWKVFKRAGQDCLSCLKAKILYAKDGLSSKRGSYFCSNCQAV